MGIITPELKIKFPSNVYSAKVSVRRGLGVIRKGGTPTEILPIIDITSEESYNGIYMRLSRGIYTIEVTEWKSASAWAAYDQKITKRILHITDQTIEISPFEESS